MRDPTLALIGHTIAPESGQAWHGGPTPVGALRGVSAKEAAWRPAPGRHSIWDLALHIAYWKYAVRRHLLDDPIPHFPRSPSNWPAVPARPTEAAWKADRALLAAEHRALREAIGRFPAARLGRRLRCAVGAALRRRRARIEAGDRAADQLRARDAEEPRERLVRLDDLAAALPQRDPDDVGVVETPPAQ